jgi:HlyD family secretion protein
MQRLLIRLVIVIFLLGSAAGGVGSAVWWWQQRSQPKYLTAKVSRGRIETVVNSTGTVKPVRTVSVGAFTSGPIKEIYVDFNSPVKEKQIIALIDDRLALATVEHDEAVLESQRADLERMKALRDQAKNNETRARKLLAINKDYLSLTDMDTYIFTLKTSEAQIKLGEASIRQAEATLKNSRQNLDYTKIISPVDGIIIERKVDPGQTVAASFQTPELFTIAPEMDKHIYVFASVDEADVGLIANAKEIQRAPGQMQVVVQGMGASALAPAGGLLGSLLPTVAAARLGESKLFALGVVKFTVDAHPGQLFPGRIDQIRMNSTTTQNVVTYPVVIEAPNAELKLMPGMTANITFQIESKDDVLRVPAAALRYTPPAAQVRPEDKHHVEGIPTNTIDSSKKRSANEKVEQARSRQHRLVWVQDGALLRAVPVTLGLMENQFAELLEGDLTEGQAVVTGTESLFAPR